MERIRIGAGPRILLKNGLIVDGTGKRQPYLGNVIIEGDRITAVTTEPVGFDGREIMCTGLAIAPGFIDCHSHMDWILPVEGMPELKLPFTTQGVTTFIGGNCGYSVAGHRPDPHAKFLETVGTFIGDHYRLEWTTLAEYACWLNRHGTTHNLATLAAHGTVRQSIRGDDPSPLNKGEMRLMLRLLEESLNEGACGVSLGLQYSPGIFADKDELEQIARLVERKGKILAVHTRALTKYSDAYPVFRRNHNLLAIKEMLDLAARTGVRLQISHLTFAGEPTWESVPKALDMIERAVLREVDVMFDIYSHLCGVSIAEVILPKFFRERLPEAYDNRTLLGALDLAFRGSSRLLKMGFGNFQMAKGQHPDLDPYNGMFIDAIARDRNIRNFDVFIDLARKSQGRAFLYMHDFTNDEIVKRLMVHPLCLYMTDAVPLPGAIPHAAAYGNFPKFLEFSRDHNLLSLKEVVHKMTGGPAERFGISKRGLLKKGNFADITIFNPETVKDNTTREEPDKAPSGIEAVFINGLQVHSGGRTDAETAPGVVI